MRQSTRVGVVGLGIMGSAMAANLAAAGFSVRGYDLLPKRRAELKRMGGEPAKSTRDLSGHASIVITSLPSAKALRDVASELAAAGHRGQVVVETSTLPIADKERARALLARRGITLLDCPLSGTGAQAKTRDLVVYASGTLSAYQHCVHAL